MDDIVNELFASDAASALTNRAAREIERLREELKSQFQQLGSLLSENGLLLKERNEAQARETKLREELIFQCNYLYNPFEPDNQSFRYKRMKRLLDSQQDNTALREALAAERERVATFVYEYGSYIDDAGDKQTQANMSGLAAAIRALKEH